MSQGKVSSKSYVPVGSAVEMIPSAPPLVGDEPVVNVLHVVPYDPPLRGVSNEIEDHPESDDEDEEGFTEYGVTPKWREDRPIKVDNMIFLPGDCCPIDCCCLSMASPDHSHSNHGGHGHDGCHSHGCHGHGYHGHACHGCNDCHGSHHCVEGCIYCCIHGIVHGIVHIR